MSTHLVEDVLFVQGVLLSMNKGTPEMTASLRSCNLEFNHLVKDLRGHL